MCLEKCLDSKRHFYSVGYVVLVIDFFFFFSRSRSCVRSCLFCSNGNLLLVLASTMQRTAWLHLYWSAIDLPPRLSSLMQPVPLTALPSGPFHTRVGYVIVWGGCLSNPKAKSCHTTAVAPWAGEDLGTCHWHRRQHSICTSDRPRRWWVNDRSKTAMDSFHGVVRGLY